MKRSRKKSKRKKKKKKEEDIKESDDELPERDVKRRKIETPPTPPRPVTFWSLSNKLIGHILSFLVESEKKRICFTYGRFSKVFFNEPNAWSEILRDFNQISMLGYYFSMEYFMKFKNIHSKFTTIFVDDLDNNLLSIITKNMVNVRQIYATNVHVDMWSLCNDNLKEIELYWNYTRNKRYPLKDENYKDAMNLIFKTFDYKSICKCCFGPLLDDNGIICQSCDMIFCGSCEFFEKGRFDLFFIDSCSVCNGANGSRYRKFTRYK